MDVIKVFWVAEMRSGSQSAFEDIFRHFYPSLCFFAGRFLANHAIADEIAQDSLLKVWERRNEFENLESVKAFLYISTKNACFDEINKQERKLNRDHRYYLSTPEVESAVDEDIIYAELLRDLAQAIDQLPVQCRKIMKMLFQEEKKTKEIARELNISISTVNNQKSRAIVLLRKKLLISSTKLLNLLFIYGHLK